MIGEEGYFFFFEEEDFVSRDLAAGAARFREADGDSLLRAVGGFGREVPDSRPDVGPASRA
jgi:hypothetical protein